jgi:hypothetical protein
VEAAAASASDARARHTAGVVAAAAAAADARARHTAEEAALQERARNAAAMRAAEQVAASEQAAAAVAAGSEEEPVGLMAQLVPHPSPSVLGMECLWWNFNLSWALFSYHQAQ